MEIAKIKVSSLEAEVVSQKPVPAGIVGATIRVEYTDPIWEGLRKTVVFNGCTAKDVLSGGSVITVPAEVVARPGANLLVSFYGVGANNALVVPTLRASLGKIQPAADPSGDASTEPTLPVWAQLQQEVENLRESGGISGGDGFSPTATVEQTDAGATITITDKNGTTTATIVNGKDGAAGAQGPKGDQGIPGENGNGIAFVQVSSSTNGPITTVSFILDNGEVFSFDVENGRDGAAGPQGPKGDTGAAGPQGPKGDVGPQGAQGAPGVNGTDGKTPVKGTDYYTNADKAEMVAAVIAALPDASEVSY